MAQVKGENKNLVSFKFSQSPLQSPALKSISKHTQQVTHLEPDILDCGSQVGLRKHHYEQS